MGQKTNSNILRIGINGNEWRSKFIYKTKEESSLLVFKNLEIKTYIEQFLMKNGLLLHDYKIHINNKSMYLYISYFTTLKSVFLINQVTTEQKLKLKREKLKIHRKPRNNSNSNLKLVKRNDFGENSLSLKRNSLLKNYKIYLRRKKYKSLQCSIKNNFAESLIETLSLYTNQKYNIYITFQNLNSSNTINLQKGNWKKRLLLLKRYKKNKFFKDTINILLIILKCKNSAQLFAKFLARQLSVLNRQSYFLIFLKRALNIFVNSTLSNILGIKIIIKGKFNGRPRARNNILSIGRVPTQTLNINVNYYQSVAFSSTGTFGIKVWIAERR